MVKNIVGKFDVDGIRLPIKIDSTSNGEFSPIPLSQRKRFGNQLAHESAAKNARRLGVDRRSFLVSACGAASTLLAFNEANAAAGQNGGFFDVPRVAALDEDAAAASVAGDEFIFDVQGHFVSPDWVGRMAGQLPSGARPFGNFATNAGCDISGAGFEYLQCLSSEAFIKDVFLDSDTDMMVLSFVPSTAANEAVTIEEADAVRRIVDEMEGTHRLLLHGRVNPNQDGDIDRMGELAGKWGVSAWKTYTQWGPNGKGYFLDDPDTGIPFIEHARALGVKVICIHKGFPFGPQSYEHSQCTDIGRVAKRYPDMSFIVYHSGFVPRVKERAFQPGAGQDGIDTLVQSLIDNDVGPGSNVYAELGSTWRALMQDPESAAHALGKLLKYVGEDNVVWGTDSIWYGSPQDQIQAFRTFQITEAFQEEFGYAPITPEVRSKIFGLNATKPYRISAAEVRKHATGDTLSIRKAAYADNPDPHFRTYGPRNRREFLNLIKAGGGAG